MTTNFFSPLSFDAVFGSGIRDPGWVKIRIRDPGSGINIPDPQHCRPGHVSPGTSSLKVPKREIFDRSDFPDFYTIKFLREGDFGVKI